MHCCEIKGTQLIKFSKFLGLSGLRGGLGEQSAMFRNYFMHKHANYVEKFWFHFLCSQNFSNFAGKFTQSFQTQKQTSSRYQAYRACNNKNEEGLQNLEKLSCKAHEETEISAIWNFHAILSSVIKHSSGARISHQNKTLDLAWMKPFSCNSNVQPSFQLDNIRFGV